ncbi:C1 family peptidase [Flavilitoribacter nigricans]|nr:C1 family peptidase [Flavilitoribacter nigricans]
MKKIIWFSSLFLLVLSMPAMAQEPATGLLFDDEVYDTLSRMPAYDGSKDLDLPVRVDLSPFCPEVRNQGDIFSCVGWAVGYGALTIRRAIRAGWTDKTTITANAYSALFIYNQIREGSCRQGSRLSAAMELLQTTGDCPANVFDFNVEDCEKQPAPAVIEMARRDTISDYLTLFGRKDNAQTKIWKVKRALAQKEPVIIGMEIRQNFYQLSDATFWWPDLGNTNPAGGHAMTVVGYDDEVQAFLLFNSWGTSWGDKGYIRVKYEHFAEYCKYAYILIGSLGSAPQTATTPNAPAPVRELVKMAGSSQLKHLTGVSGGEPIFKNTALAGEQGLYRTRQQWTTGQLFQLSAATRSSNIYLYAFTVDQGGQVHIHWPRKGSLNKKFAGTNESALVVEPESRVTIPGPNKALRISRPGRDVLYILFSKRKIRGLKFICTRMAESNDQPMQRLQQLMGKHLIPPSDIEYGKNLAIFAARTRSEGYIVPLILIADSAESR